MALECKPGPMPLYVQGEQMQARHHDREAALAGDAM
jgi:hypothetical protein